MTYTTEVYTRLGLALRRTVLELSPDEIVSAYPSLTLSDVHAALAYYYDQRAEIDADIKTDDEHWTEMRQHGPGRLIDRLKARKANAADNL
ncbi:MAG: DUF433 domain-containing protein [Isosphaeraceae bacterium]